MDSHTLRYSMRESNQKCGSDSRNGRFKIDVWIFRILLLELLVAVFMAGYLVLAFQTTARPIIEPETQAKINTFMEKHGGIAAKESRYNDGVVYEDTSQVYCENDYYGRIGNYAYAYVSCGAYHWQYSYDRVFPSRDGGDVSEEGRRTIEISRKINGNRGSSIKTRFLIADGDDFEILGFEQPTDSMYYDKEWLRIWEFFPFKTGPMDGRLLSCRAKQRFYKDNKRVPKPTQIPTSYAQGNPKTVYKDDDILSCRRPDFRTTLYKH